MKFSCVTFPLSLLINYYPSSPTPKIMFTKKTFFQKPSLNQDSELVPLYSKSQLKIISNNNGI